MIYGIFCALGGAKTCTMALLNIYQNLKCPFLIQKLLSGFDWSVCMHPLLIKNGHGKSQFFADDFPSANAQLQGTSNCRAGCGIPHSWSVIIPNTLWWTYKKLLKMAIELVDFPMKKGDFPLPCYFTRGYILVSTVPKCPQESSTSHCSNRSLLRHGRMAPCEAPCDRCQSSLLARLSCQLVKWIFIL